jgi:exonuclease III
MHWHSRESRSEVVDHYERGGAMALFRHYLEERLGKDMPAVIMGDFNTSPHDRDMTSPYCLFALPNMNRSRRGSERVMGREKRPWHLTDPKKPSNVGTYYYGKDGMWHVFDHVVLTPELKPAFVGAKVLTELEQNKFLTKKKQIPRGEKFASDHLPVVCEIHYV